MTYVVLTWLAGMAVSWAYWLYLDLWHGTRAERRVAWGGVAAWVATVGYAILGVYQVLL